MFVSPPPALQAYLLELLQSQDAEHLAAGLREVAETVDGTWDDAFLAPVDSAFDQLTDEMVLAIFARLVQAPGPVFDRLIPQLVHAALEGNGETGLYHYWSSIYKNLINMVLHGMERQLARDQLFPLVVPNGRLRHLGGRLRSYSLELLCQVMANQFFDLQTNKQLWPKILIQLWLAAPDPVAQLTQTWADHHLILGDMLQALLRAPGHGQVVGQLFELLLAAQQSKPTTDWLRRWRLIQARLPSQPLRDALVSLVQIYSPEHLQERASEAREAHVPDWWAWRAAQGNPQARNLTRGATWALASYPDLETQTVLVQTVLAWSRSGEGQPLIANAAIWSLATMGNPAAVTRLSDLLSKVKHRSLHRRLQITVEAAAAEQGLSLDELTDRLTPDHGLDAQHRRTWSLGEYRITLEIAPNGQVQRQIVNSNGAVVHNLSKAARETHASALHEIQAEVRGLSKDLTLLKNRLEEAMVNGRRWPLAGWQQTILAHPILGQL